MTHDINKKIRHIQLISKKVIRGLLQGQSRSVIKGSGFDFDQIREYQDGDDMRTIDWKSTARANKLLVKQFKEEKQRTILVAVDISSSTSFLSQEQSKDDLMTQLAGVFALVGGYANDAVGLLLFSDRIEQSIAPATGKKHMHAIVQALSSVTRTNKKTSIHVALEYISHMKQQQMMVLMISDFISESFEKPLSLVARKHELIAISCLDQREQKLPSIGYITIKDQETGATGLINLNGGGARTVNMFLKNYADQRENLFKKNGVDHVVLQAGKPYMRDLMQFLKQRLMR